MKNTEKKNINIKLYLEKGEKHWMGPFTILQAKEVERVLIYYDEAYSVYQDIDGTNEEIKL